MIPPVHWWYSFKRWYHSWGQVIVESIQNADENEAEPLTDEEKRIIARIAGTFPDKQMVYDASHREEVWIKRSPGELIPYTAAEELTEI